MSRADRFSGCLVGLAVGDALGYPVEGWTQDQILGRYGRIKDFVESPTEPPDRWRSPGLHSDDTQQALIIADAIIETGHADPDTICQKFLELAEGPSHLSLGAHRGAGRNFRYTVQALHDGAAWNRASRHTAGVGASMRVAPVGLAFGIDDAAMRVNAAQQALITHNDPRSVAASFLVAHTVGRMAWFPPSPFQAEAVLQEAIWFVRRSEDWLIEAHGRSLARECRAVLHHMSDALNGIVGQIDKPAGQVLPGIAERASELAGYMIEHPCRGFAPAGIVSAFWFFLHFKGDLERALEEAVNWGGDADTVGAIVGALCGALRGLDAIPQRWRDGLRGYELVLSRARALAGDKSAAGSRPDLADTELRWTMEEDILRREKTGQPPVDVTGWVRQGVVRKPVPVAEPEFREERYRDDRRRDDRRRDNRHHDDRRGERRDDDRHGGELAREDAEPAYEMDAEPGYDREQEEAFGESGPRDASRGRRPRRRRRGPRRES